MLLVLEEEVKLLLSQLDAGLLVELGIELDDEVPCGIVDRAERQLDGLVRGGLRAVLVVLVSRHRSSVRPCLRVLDGRLVALAAFSSFSPVNSCFVDSVAMII